MEIPVLTRVTDFEASINSLNTNPTSLISRLISILQLARRFSFSTARLLLWKWTPILLALIYTLTSLARRIRIRILRRRQRVINNSLRKPLLYTTDYESDEFSTDTDDDDEEEDDDEDEEVSCSNSPSDDEKCGDESISSPFSTSEMDFRVAGWNRLGEKRKFNIRRKRSMTGFENPFSLPELVNGKSSVVKFWDGLGLGLNCLNSSSTTNKSISILDLERDVRIGSILGDVPAAVSVSSPTVVFTASSGGGKMGLNTWDVRLRMRKPAMEVEWNWPTTCDEGSGVMGVNFDGVQKVYVRSYEERVVVVGRDMRKAVSPLVDVTTELEGW